MTGFSNLTRFHRIFDRARLEARADAAAAEGLPRVGDPRNLRDPAALWMRAARTYPALVTAPAADSAHADTQPATRAE